MSGSGLPVGPPSLPWEIRTAAFHLEESNRMRQITVASLGTILLVTAFGLCGTLSGCGDGNDTSEVTSSPEAKKADTALQGGMKDFMQSKGKTKAPSK
jgi:hypothetical protein